MASRSQRLRHAFPIIAAVLVVAGCDRSDRRERSVVVIGPAASPLAAQLVRAATTDGLVALDAQGDITPALADRWIVTDDGQSYIFRLRAGVWPDGTPISGESVRVALRQALAGIAHTPLALDLDGIDDVRAMAGRVVEIRLRQAMPDFLQLLAQPELGLRHRGQGTGPLALRRKDGETLLIPVAPEKRGGAVEADWADNSRGLRLGTAAAPAAVAAFANGRADVVLGGTFDGLPDTGRMSLGNARPRFDPVIGLFGLAVTQATGLLADAALREAVAMAIDRDTLPAAIARPMLQTTTRIVPPGTSDDTGRIDERWATVSLAARRAEAARRILAWTAQSHQPAVLRILLPPGPGADLLAARLAQDLAAVSIRLVRVEGTAPADLHEVDLRLVDIVARYPRAAWFLNQLSCTANRLACSPDADAIAARARTAGDPVVAADLTAQAEASLTQANVYIPLGIPIRWSLVAGDGAGFAINRWGRHSLAALARGDR